MFMRILFDYQTFETQRIGGVSRSYAELISHLRDEECNCVVGVKESDNVYLHEKDMLSGIKPLHYRHSLFFGNKKCFKGQYALTRMLLGLFGERDDFLKINRNYCISLLKKNRFDVFEPTFFDSYFLPYLKGKPFVLTVHDMIPELFPRYFARDDFQIVQKRLLCPLAAHIHVPSLRTKEDLVNILNVSPDKVTVIPHGRSGHISDDYSDPPIFDFPYLLYVGDRYGYKNYTQFARECSYIIQKYPEIRVVFTGKEFTEIEKMDLMQFGMEKNVIHHFASDESLKNLYHYAVAFVYPSAYEGFGLPILEAFVNDCPVMLNNASCFPEVAEDAAIYFDIEKDGDLCEKFADFYTSWSGMRTEMIQKGRRQAEKYSWEKSAELLKGVYNMLV